MKSNVMKRLVSAMIALVMALSLCACGGNETPTESEGVSSDATVSQTETETGTAEVEARTAIVFSMIDTGAEGDGSVFVMRGGEAQDAYEGMRLTVGDTVITDFFGLAYLRIDDDKNILLDKSSTLEITEMTGGNLLLTLLSGEFFFDVQNKLASNEKMAFAIGGATMSIRGTSGSGVIDNAQQPLANSNFDAEPEGTQHSGNQSFSIYTGVGDVQSSEGNKIELKAGASASSSDNGQSFTQGAAGVSGLQQQYIGTNPSYGEELNSVSSSSASSDSSSEASSLPEQSSQPAVQSQASSSSSSSSDESESSDETESMGNMNKVKIVSGGDGGSSGGFMGLFGGAQVMPCGHTEGTAGDHNLLGCGLHYACGGGTHLQCAFAPDGPEYRCDRWSCVVGGGDYCARCGDFYCSDHEYVLTEIILPESQRLDGRYCEACVEIVRRDYGLGN